MHDAQLALTQEEARHVLGGQANLWTEHVDSWALAEYMLLPRLAAMSEALWSQPQAKDWQGFRQRLEEHQQHWRHRGYNFRPLEGS